MTKRLAKLKFVAGSGQYGLNFPATDYVDHGIRLIRTTDLVGGTLASNENGIFVPEHAVSSGDKLLPGDLLLSRSGTIGRAFLTPSEAEGMAFAGFLVRFRPGPEVETQYLFYCTQSNDFQFAVHSDAVSSTIQNFNADRYNNIKIPIPPLDEQRAIADYLDQETAQIDALVAKQEEFIGLLRERRFEEIKSATGWGHQLPDNWTRARLSHLFRTTGSGTTPANEEVLDVNAGDVSWVTTGELREQKITDTQRSVSLSTLKKYSALKVYPAGTLLVAMYGATIGRTGLLEIPAATNQACCALVDPIGVIAEFVEYSLIAGRAWLLLDASGGGQPNINQDKVRAFRIPVPPIEEQRAIVERINEQTTRIDNLIAKAEEHIALAKERRSALITAAVTGQFDVRTAKKGARV